MKETPRPILYRAKPLDSMTYGNDYISGSYIYVDDNKNIPISGPQIVSKHYILTYFPGDWNMGSWEQIEIDPKTLQQCVFLRIPCGPPGSPLGEYTCDLFEGDLVQRWGSSSVWILEWCYKELRFKFSLFHGALDIDVSQDLENIYKVGSSSVFDRQELLERKEYLPTKDLCLYLCNGQDKGGSEIYYKVWDHEAWDGKIMIYKVMADRTKVQEFVIQNLEEISEIEFLSGPEKSQVCESMNNLGLTKYLGSTTTRDEFIQSLSPMPKYNHRSRSWE